jgi:hypothetical protein
MTTDNAQPPLWMVEDFAALAAGDPDRALAYRLWPHVADALDAQEPAAAAALRAALVAGSWRCSYEADDELVEWLTVVVAGFDLARIDTRRLIPPQSPPAAGPAEPA